MKKSNNNSKKGFTIIEVVLVLAIAGLIFLMVFIALPALQRSQRDTQRRNDYSALVSAISSFATNNNGKLPADDATLAPAKYLNSTGEDPNGNTYDLKVIDLSVSSNTVTALTAIPDTNTATTVRVYTSADCSDADTNTGAAKPKKVASKRSFAVYGNLEAGNGTYCQASQS